MCAANSTNLDVFEVIESWLFEIQCLKIWLWEIWCFVLAWNAAIRQRKYTEFVANMYQNWDLISLHFCLMLFQLEAWNELDASSEDGFSTGIHQPAKRLCMCLFIWGIVFLSLRMLIQNQLNTLASKMNVLWMCVCSSNIDILYWETNNYLLMKVGWGNLGILKE